MNIEDFCDWAHADLCAEIIRLHGLLSQSAESIQRRCAMVDRLTLQLEKTKVSPDREMIERFRAKARGSYEIARVARRRGNRKKWEKFNSVARVWNLAADDLERYFETWLL